MDASQPPLYSRFQQLPSRFSRQTRITQLFFQKDLATTRPGRVLSGRNVGLLRRIGRATIIHGVGVTCSARKCPGTYQGQVAPSGRHAFCSKDKQERVSRVRPPPDWPNASRMCGCRSRKCDDRGAGCVEAWPIRCSAARRELEGVPIDPSPLEAGFAITPSHQTTARLALFAELRSRNPRRYVRDHRSEAEEQHR